jgi:hypothetical protein
MVYFHAKNLHNLRVFWKALVWKILVYVNRLWPIGFIDIGMFSGSLVHFFRFLVYRTKNQLAILALRAIKIA